MYRHVGIREQEAFQAFLEPVIWPGIGILEPRRAMSANSSIVVEPTVQHARSGYPETFPSPESAEYYLDQDQCFTPHSSEDIALNPEFLHPLEQETDEPEDFSLTTSPRGIITLLLSNGIRVDMTVTRSIRIINPVHSTMVSLSSDGASSYVQHPKGSVYQCGSRVDIVAIGEDGVNKYAKMWHKGVSFSSDRCPLVYLVDDAGTRTTVGDFTDMTQDYSVPIFYERARFGRRYLQEAVAIEESFRYWVERRSGAQNWLANKILVTQYPNGRVRVKRNGGMYEMSSSTMNGKVSVTTPNVHCTGSQGRAYHMFVRSGERRMHYDRYNFIVRSAGNSAGVDKKNRFRMF